MCLRTLVAGILAAGLMPSADAQTAPTSSWKHHLTLYFVGLGVSGERGGAEVDADQWMVEVTGGYELRPFVTLLAGGILASGESGIRSRRRVQKGNP